MEGIRSVGVVGAGTMGLGIAQTCASSGFAVLLYDVNARQAEAALRAVEANLSGAVSKGKLSAESKVATLSRIRIISALSAMKADLVIEAIIERLDVKQELFVQLEKINEGRAILASNTSSISVTKIAQVLQDPSCCIGLHFFNPAERMKLVEIISTGTTCSSYLGLVKRFAMEIGKTTVMAKDSPGFIVNRVARHYYVESLKLLEDGATDVSTMDTLLKASGFKMGPFELMDLIGLDINLAVTTSVYEGFGKAHKFAPSSIQQKLVQEGHVGRKSGKGFYKYGEKEK